jgi:hypothetical protein
MSGERNDISTWEISLFYEMEGLFLFSSAQHIFILSPLIVVFVSATP